MALPNNFTISSKTSPAKQQRESDDFAMELLQSLYSQQDEHQRLVDQLKSLSLFWDKQQKWNKYANKSKHLKEMARQVQMKHAKQNEEWRIQKLMMQHQNEMQEEQREKEHLIEMQKVQQQLAENRQEWKGVMEDLNSHQAAVHAQFSGRIVTKEGDQRQWDQNKEVLMKLIHKLQQRTQQTQVATGESAGERAMGGASMSRSADDVGGGEGSGAKKSTGKKRHSEEAASGESPSSKHRQELAVNDED